MIFFLSVETIISLLSLWWKPCRKYATSVLISIICDINRITKIAKNKCDLHVFLDTDVIVVEKENQQTPGYVAYWSLTPLICVCKMGRGHQLGCHKQYSPYY